MAEATQPVAPPAPGSEAYNVAMAAKFDTAQGIAAAAPAATGSTPEDNPAGAPVVEPPAAPAQRPDDVPEKFWDATKGQLNTEALLKSYKALEASKATTPPAPPQAPAGEAPEALPGDPPQAGKVDVAALSAELAANGALSEASYASLASQGYDKTFVDSYIAGQQALAAQASAAIFTEAGGEAQYKAMAAWAATKLSPAEVAAFDAAVTGDSMDMARLAVAGLKAKYAAANPPEPKLLQGGSGGEPPSGGEGGYASSAEMTAAMRDPRYRTDAAYRAVVERRTSLMQ